MVMDGEGAEYFYKKLIWAADSHTMYKSLSMASIRNNSTRRKIQAKQQLLANKTGGDSILTVYVMLEMDVLQAKQHLGEHTFYTPITEGLSNRSLWKMKEGLIIDGVYTTDKEKLLQWVESYLSCTTYEISCPAMRDSTLAPCGKTGLIVSTLFDYNIVKHMKNLGLYDVFKTLCEQKITELIMENILFAYKGCPITTFSYTPLSVEKITGNTQGAITGWAFTNSKQNDKDCICS